MGEARRRKRLAAKLGLTPRPAAEGHQMRVRQLTLNVPVELAERLHALCPPQWAFRDWLVGALGAFVEWGEREKECRAEDAMIVKPYRAMPPTPPSGALLGGRR